MKICCSIQVVNHSYHHLNQKKKSSLATLSLCHKLPSEQEHCEKNAFLIVSTQKNPLGTKYKVYNNVDLFVKFINEGKATVRVKEPPHDIIIKADHVKLKSFMSGISLILSGKGNGKVLLSPPPTKFERPKRQLVVLNRKDYPLRPGFPPSLVKLQVQNCHLKKIDARMLQLQHLEVLDLANNCIKELPLAMANMKLEQLILSNNEIEVFPPALSHGILAQNLRTLDLSNNRIKWLSPYFCQMKKLISLSLNCNGLVSLPRNIECLTSLRLLSASHNNMKVLPYGIKKLCLDSLDLFHNPLDEEIILIPNTFPDVPSLLECSAVSVIKNGLLFAPEEIPMCLVDYLNDHCKCICGHLIFQTSSFCVFAMDLRRLASTVIHLNNVDHLRVPLKIQFCSVRCWKNFYRQLVRS